MLGRRHPLYSDCIMAKVCDSRAPGTLCEEIAELVLQGFGVVAPLARCDWTFRSFN